MNNVKDCIITRRLTELLLLLLFTLCLLCICWMQSFCYYMQNC